MRRQRNTLLGLLIGAFLAFAAGGAAAQQQAQAQDDGRGQARIQARTGQEQDAGPATGGFQNILDLREEMRGFVQRIAQFARRTNPRFLIIARGGLELLVKRSPTDDTGAPARTYIRTLDGLLVDGMFFGLPAFGEPSADNIREGIKPLVEMAKRNGLPIMTMDFAEVRETVDEVLTKSAALGFALAVVPAPSEDLGALPPYPRRPFGENAKSILSPKDVRNFAYIANSAAFGRQDEFALKIHGTNYDAVIVDVFHGREPLSRRAVETLKYKKLGARRLVFARMNVGTAASYYYWREGWREGSPLWISSPHPDDPDRYFVEFWRSSWQGILNGNPQSYLYGIIAQGYDGVVLEGLNAFRFFEGGADVYATALP